MADKKDRKQKQPKHDEFHDAPESGTVVDDVNPSQPSDAHNDQPKDSIGEAPESGTIRER